jgi:hypothetical protein
VSTVTAVFWHGRQGKIDLQGSYFQAPAGTCQSFASRFPVVGIAYTSWHERGTTTRAVSIADLLAYIVSLTIILFLWLQ